MDTPDADVTVIELHLGDCVEILPTLQGGSVHLVVTSPPYAMMHAKHYAGVETDLYPAWWMSVMEAIDHVLAPGGSVAINWQAGKVDSMKQDWDVRSLIAMLDGGWTLRDEYCWEKLNPKPLGGKYSMPPSWDRILHMTRTQEDPHAWNCDQVRSAGNVIRSAVGGHRKTHNAFTRRGHPAAFPPEIPRYFVRLLSNPGDTVLDPFAGSGQTLHVALEEGRNAVGIERKAEYHDSMVRRFEIFQMSILGDHHAHPAPVP